MTPHLPGGKKDSSQKCCLDIYHLFTVTPLALALPVLSFAHFAPGPVPLALPHQPLTCSLFYFSLLSLETLSGTYHRFA